MMGKAYLFGAMLRRLLACLALISGLVAVSTPAHADLLEAIDRMEISAEDSDKTKTAITACEQKQQAQRQRGEKPSPCVQDRTVRIFIPSVMFGPDRALE